MLIPSLSDRSLAPDGQHALSITAKFGPYQLGEASWDERRKGFGDPASDTLPEYACNVKDPTVQRGAISPWDLEPTHGLSEGGVDRGEVIFDRFRHMRPIPGEARQ